MFFRILIAIVFLGNCAITHAQKVDERSDNQVSLAGIRALAILQTLNANLLASKSATQTLQAWCEDHQMAPMPKIIALRDAQTVKEANEEIRTLLKVSDAEPVRYRRVRLVCGNHVLSQADNWYVPSRLTDDMNLLLMQTDTPFGTAVRQLNFHRQTERSTLLWNPLPKNWDQKRSIQNKGPIDLKIPELVLQHQAILLTDKNIPFSVVIESYTNEIFAFPMNER